MGKQCPGVVCSSSVRWHSGLFLRGAGEPNGGGVRSLSSAGCASAFAVLFRAELLLVYKRK